MLKHFYFDPLTRCYHVFVLRGGGHYIFKNYFLNFLTVGEDLILFLRMPLNYILADGVQG